MNLAVLQFAITSRSRAVASRPIPLASIGIAGLGLAWRLAGKAQRAPAIIGESIILAGAILFVTLLSAWLMRVSAHPREIRTENAVAITASYFGAHRDFDFALRCRGGSVFPSARIRTLDGCVCGEAACCSTSAGAGSKASSSLLRFLSVVGNATCVYAAVPLGMSESGWASFAVGALCGLTLSEGSLFHFAATARSSNAAALIGRCVTAISAASPGAHPRRIVHRQR